MSEDTTIAQRNIISDQLLSEPSSNTLTTRNTESLASQNILTTTPSIHRPEQDRQEDADNVAEPSQGNDSRPGPSGLQTPVRSKPSKVVTVGSSSEDSSNDEISVEFETIGQSQGGFAKKDIQHALRESRAYGRGCSYGKCEGNLIRPTYGD